MCPIGKEPIEEQAGQIEYKGKTIGFCCPGCSDKFMAWDESQRDEFVSMSMMHTEPGTEANPAPTETAPVRVGDPYPLSTCPISGEELGGDDMGDPIVKIYDGREVKFCCKMCVPKFEKDLKASFAALDAKIIESQLPYYPLTTCMVSGDTFGGLDEDGEPMGKPINFVYNNRLIRFCCKMCKGDFKKDPEAYIAKLDAAVIAQQSEHYPLSTCPISGEDLSGDEMGEPIKKVYNGRLVEFCCKKCVAKFEKNPAPTLKKLDAAWLAMHSEAHGEEGESHGDHDGHGEHEMHDMKNMKDMDHGHAHGDHDDG